MKHGYVAKRLLTPILTIMCESSPKQRVRMQASVRNTAAQMRRL